MFYNTAAKLVLTCQVIWLWSNASSSRCAVTVVVVGGVVGWVGYSNSVNKDSVPVGVGKTTTCLTRLCWQGNKTLRGGAGGCVHANKTEPCCLCVSGVPLMCLLCRLRVPLPPPDKMPLISHNALRAVLERTVFRQRSKLRHDSVVGSASTGCPLRPLGSRPLE